jgi:hypothetical protein
MRARSLAADVHEAEVQDAEVHEAELHAADDHEALDQDADDQEALDQDAELQDAPVRAADDQLATSNTGPAGVCARKPLSARFGFGGSVLRVVASFKSSSPTPTEPGTAFGRAFAVSIS